MAKRVKRDIWEKVFVYPSFNTRFFITTAIVLIIFFLCTYIILFHLDLIHGIEDQVAVSNLIVQLATLVLGIFAAYYALRQLVETRFTGLDEAGMQELKRSHYSRAFEKWREAFYIKPEASVFTNMMEALLLVGDYDTFDEYIRIPQNRSFSGKEIFQEVSDQIVLLYLKSIRHLLVKNQGETEKQISSIVELVKKESLPNLAWDFMDLRRSLVYQDLNGECKQIAENLISYLSKDMPSVRKAEFETGNFASRVDDMSENIVSTPALG